MRRVSSSWPLPSTRSVNGVRPKPVLTARHVEVDRRLIESRIAGRDAEHFAIVRAVRRADADGEHRRPAASDAASTCPTCLA
mgnify:CR=1 FL=1